MRVHVVSDEADRDGGHLFTVLKEHDATLVTVDRDGLGPDGLRGEAADLVVLLGSRRSAHRPRGQEVVNEIRYVLDALDRGVPVMGICYGAQLLARALGGGSERAPRPEVGWHRIETSDPVLCPPGPWLQFHGDVFRPGPTSRVIGTTEVGPQAILDESRPGRAIGWQFHPEVSDTTFERWVTAGYLAGPGIEPSAILDEFRRAGESSETRAIQLLRDALRWLGVDRGPRA